MRLGRRHLVKMWMLVALLGLVSSGAVSGTHHTRSNGTSQPVRGMVVIPGGYYRPFYIEKGIDSVRIAPFYMDVAPVTNAEFLEFVRANRSWSRSNVPRAFAEHGYLRQWKSDFEIGNRSLERAPVVNVSWFAAHAYAKWVHKRLPTVNEWEYASLAPIVSLHGAVLPTSLMGAAKKGLVLDWYAQPNVSELPASGTINENAYGVKDMFGNVWEWTEDFNSTIISVDTRGTPNPSSTCGAGALGTTDPTDYATFMRFAMRNSLMASYTVENVGFRCVKDINQ